MKPYSIALILTSDEGTHFAIAFWTSFFWQVGQSCRIFQIFNYLSFSFPLVSSHSTPLASPPQTSKKSQKMNGHRLAENRWF
jgi:hypothetical protein